MKLNEPSPKHPPERPDWPNWTEDENANQLMKVTVPLGLGVTILIHLLAIWGISRIDVRVIDKEPERNPPIEVEFLPPIEPLPEFVETNPVANQEKPEDTTKISAQDQVAAQEEPDPTQQDDSPKVEGEEVDSNKIVQGDVLSEPGAPSLEMSEAAPQTPPSPMDQAQESPVVPQQQTSEQLPTETQQEMAEQTQSSEPQFLEQEISEAAPGVDDVQAAQVEEAPQAEEGFMAATETGKAEIQVEETTDQTAQPQSAQDDRLEVYMEEVRVEPADQSAPSSTPAPQARPRLNFVRATSGPLRNDPRSTNRVGTVSVDANFDKFGAYLQRMIEAIQQQWLIIARSSSTITAELGSRVVVQYTINQQGVITNLEVLYSSASRSGTVICMEAIQSRAPFGIWTEEMARTLGESQKITITFWYR